MSGGTAGRLTTVFWDRYDLSRYFSELSLPRQQATAQVSGFGLTSHEFIAGQEGGSLSAQGPWNDDAAATDPLLDAAISSAAASIVTVVPAGGDAAADLGNAAWLAQIIDSDYSIRGTQADAVRIAASGEADAGIRHGGKLLHPLVARTAAANYASVDESASSANGAVGHLHVTAFTGTTCTITIEDSPNDSTWSTLITFDAVTGVIEQRKTVTGTVDRYLRATLAGTFTSITFAVASGRNRR